MRLAVPGRTHAGTYQNGMSVLALVAPGHPQHHSAVLVWIIVVAAILVVIGSILLFTKRPR